ncbi:transcription activator [Perilla frutescens var. hirtella]|nr:transcription activator [Perilla frutescens var. hirtella]
MRSAAFGGNSDEFQVRIEPDFDDKVTGLRKQVPRLCDNLLIREGKGMSSVLYTYRSCVKALPQVLDLEMSRLREIQRWQASASSKLAADMQHFSRPERRINGPTITHLWSMLKLLDVLVQLDHLKNAKASIPNDFSWYKRTFTQVSVQWQDTDSIREELDDLQIFLSTRWAILLNLHVEMFRVNKYPSCQGVV